ncbi:MAG TPA: FG-GAP-like repeat-containing protein [Gemmatimonadaceae bacterium]
MRLLSFPRRPLRPLRLIWLALALTSCGPREKPVFELLSPEQTGVTFANTITTNDSLNVQSDVYVYNGAGVAVGDVDNDGLPDIFFAGNMVSSRLYRNKGHMRFEDITERAGVETNRWATGVAMVDINNDGYLDIYVSVSGPPWSRAADRANLLFINKGNGTFAESAAKYGIADTNFTTQSVFFDYNRDGCLDLFVLNNSPKDFTRGASAPMGPRAGALGVHNALYRNNCDGTFTDVSNAAGIVGDAGYGLGVVVSDLDGDGWPDIYVSNDVLPNDVVYVNNRDGTFTNKAARLLKHGSFAGMGVDIADFNNDGWPDIIQADMMPHDMRRRKRVTGFLTYSGLLATRSEGFRDDYSLNSLQLNNGVTNGGDAVFSEISRMAGVSSTDWSWSALFADFDNDGYKDIFITNGYPKAVTDLDYQTAMSATRGRSDAARRQREILRSLPGFEGSNYVFRNNRDLTFADMSKPWGTARAGYSYGAAYADLDNDGRLDLVVNNVDGAAFIYRNVTPNDDAHHYLRVRLEGDAQNPRGIGTTLTLWTGRDEQTIYATPYRGYMSTVDDRPHFGLGHHASADSLVVRWPDGDSQTLTNVAADREIVVKHSAATSGTPPQAPSNTADRIFQPVEPSRVPAYQQRLNSVVDYEVQPLLPYMLSRHGPPLAVGDVNGDGLDDVYVGGGNGLAGKLFIQQKDGRFLESAAGQPWDADIAFEDWGAVFFDANGDGLPDLYVASGGYQLAPESPLLQDRLYINQGNGRFRRDPNALPAMLTSKGVVRVGDFNGDGRPDLFVAGRLTPRRYPTPTRSYVLRNDGGHFTDVTAEVAPELVSPGGMVTDAAWVDLDGDDRLDLVTVGEWMPIRFFHNEGQRFRDVTASINLPPLRGWWYSLAIGDFNHDGRPDLIAGNLGLNYSYAASATNPFGVYAGDFTGNRAMDLVLTQTIDGTEYPYYGLVTLGKSIYPLTIRFPTYGAFADATLRQALSDSQRRQAIHYEADTFASMYLRNDGGLKFSAAPLPMLAQISPIRGIVVFDVDHDGKLDAIVAGNLDDVEANTPPADAGNGLWLRGNGAGRFTAISPRMSGFLAPGPVTGLALVKTIAGVSLLVANAGDSLRAFAIGKR